MKATFEDVCKAFALKQAQDKRDRETLISRDYIKTGKNHKAFKWAWKDRGNKIINLENTKQQERKHK